MRKNREIIATLPDGMTMHFRSIEEARKVLHIGALAIRTMIEQGTPYAPVGNTGALALAGMTMVEVWNKPKPISKRSLCLTCCHIFQFEAKEGVRYVCCRYGKRITEDLPSCKGYKKGEARRFV